MTSPCRKLTSMAIEVSLRQGEVTSHPTSLEGGRTSAWEPSEADHHRGATAITATGIEQLLEESGLRVLDAEGAWGLSWLDRVGGWRSLLDSLVFLGTQEELPVFELGSHTGLCGSPVQRPGVLPASPETRDCPAGTSILQPCLARKAPRHPQHPGLEARSLRVVAQYPSL